MDELPIFLGVSKDALTEILQPNLKTTMEDRDMCLNAFGIFRKRRFPRRHGEVPFSEDAEGLQEHLGVSHRCLEIRLQYLWQSVLGHVKES